MRSACAGSPRSSAWSRWRCTSTSPTRMNSSTAWSTSSSARSTRRDSGAGLEGRRSGSAILSARQALLRHPWARAGAGIPHQADAGRPRTTSTRSHRDVPGRRLLRRPHPPRDARAGQPHVGLHPGAVRRRGLARRPDPPEAQAATVQRDGASVSRTSSRWPPSRAGTTTAPWSATAATTSSSSSSRSTCSSTASNVCTGRAGRSTGRPGDERRHPALSSVSQDSAAAATTSTFSSASGRPGRRRPTRSPGRPARRATSAGAPKASVSPCTTTIGTATAGQLARAALLRPARAGAAGRPARARRPRPARPPSGRRPAPRRCGRRARAGPSSRPSSAEPVQHRPPALVEPRRRGRDPLAGHPPRLLDPDHPPAGAAASPVHRDQVGRLHPAARAVAEHQRAAHVAVGLGGVRPCRAERGVVLLDAGHAPRQGQQRVDDAAQVRRRRRAAARRRPGRPARCAGTRRRSARPAGRRARPSRARRPAPSASGATSQTPAAHR